MRCQRGFSLVEALVALLILSIGLISMGALQLKAMQSASDGYQRTLTSVAVLDAQERLWAAYQASPRCNGIRLEDIERAWRHHWFIGGEAVLEQASGDIQRRECGFVITITHASLENAEYRVLLPDEL